MAVKASSKIYTFADLKGKKVASYAANPGVNVHMEAMLRYGNLKWDDVVATKVSGFAGGQDALMEGVVEAANVSAEASLPTRWLLLSAD